MEGKFKTKTKENFPQHQYNTKDLSVLFLIVDRTTAKFETTALLKMTSN